MIVKRGDKCILDDGVFSIPRQGVWG
jgi:hypothetical protein